LHFVLTFSLLANASRLDCPGVLVGVFLLEKFLRVPHAHGHAGELHEASGEHHHAAPAGAMLLPRQDPRGFKEFQIELLLV
jgi:hypothetical protein